MDVYKAARQRTIEKVTRIGPTFQRIFGRNIAGYIDNTADGIIWFDFARLFAEIGVPLDSSSQEIMRRMYGAGAVELIG